MVLADHGFTELKTEVCLNTWLKEQGFLSLTHAPENEWDATVIGPKAEPLPWTPAVSISIRKSFHGDALRLPKKKRLVQTIKNKLTGLTFQGEQVMEHIYTADELYPGTESDDVPDLICESRPSFDLKAKFDRDKVFGLHGRTGAHTVDGAIFTTAKACIPRECATQAAVSLNISTFRTTDP